MEPPVGRLRAAELLHREGAEPAEQREAFTVETSPAFVIGGFEVVLAAAKSETAITEAFRHGRGFGWHQHDAGLFRGTERFSGRGTPPHWSISGYPR